MQYDAAQPPGLGVDVESHVSILTAGAALHPPLVRFRRRRLPPRPGSQPRTAVPSVSGAACPGPARHPPQITAPPLSAPPAPARWPPQIAAQGTDRRRKRGAGAGRGARG
ncbi:hypothetical protein ACE1SV_49720 [Streptomyces sp. E-15]